MKIALFGSELPFSQGFALKEIAKGLKAKIIECGESLDCNSLYVKIPSVDGPVQSIWEDSGTHVGCTHLKLPNKPWQAKINGKWETENFDLEIVTR